MTITVSGARKEYAQGVTVSQLLVLENVETPEYVTVSINDEFILSANLASTELRDGDVVELLYFMGGGH